MSEVEEQLHYPLCSEIHADEEWNCRGPIPLSTVIDLAKDIDGKGLIQPITIQPYNEADQKRTGFKYRVIQGHRRFTAVSQVLKRPTIACTIKEGLSEIDALLMNFAENVQREPLNIVREAHALKRLQDADMTQMEMAKHLRKNRSWVVVRLYILDFPEEIQDKIAEGNITQSQIHQMHELPKSKWYEAVRKIEDERIKSGGKRLRIAVTDLKPPKPQNLLKKKPRTKQDVLVMLDYLMDQPAPPGIHTRALAWVAGEIETLDFLKDYREYCKDCNVPYMIPAEGIPGL